MQQIEAQAFARGISAAALMDTAGAGIAAAIRQFFPSPGTAILYLGKGNNAGDALVAAHHLHQHGWTLLARLSAPVSQFKPLPAQHWASLSGSLCQIEQSLTPADLPPGPVLLLDGLLGLGASGPLHTQLAAMAREINLLRQQAHAHTIAMDLPSGLDGDTGQPFPDAVQADLTCTVAQVKTGLLADQAINHVGRLCLIPLPELATTAGDSSAQLATAATLRPWLPRRPFDTHKGQAGRVSIVAGSPGLIGAAHLACLGALHGGAGLVTLWVPPSIYQILATRLPPEVMVRRYRQPSEILDHPHDTLVIGPGLGSQRHPEILSLLAEVTAPTIVDADALNALASQPQWPIARGPRLLTPHPGEWARLAPVSVSHHPTRRAQAEHFVAQHPGLTLLLKGARTLVAQAGQPTLFNSTGHPGMATGGMGDVLSGLLGALIAAAPGCTPISQSAALGAWLSGRAAEHAALTAHPHATLPTQLATHLGHALRDLTHLSY